MKKLLNKILNRFGLTIYSKRQINSYTVDQLKQMYSVDENDIANIRGNMGIGLKEKLTRENKTQWLDIGCGGNLDDDFHYLDTFPEGVVGKKNKYFRADIINLSKNDLARMGKFDFLRLQHVFEHFTPENGIRVLNNCARLLNKDGYILITTPDLKKYVHLYLSGKIKQNFDWALNRIDKDSPDSFYFSVFTHSMLYESHCWCYDAEGLIYQLKRTDKFKNITELPLTHELANIPFTHNRPHEDVCVLAQIK
jgi:SAM-dependent methyltransferase